MNYLDKTLKRAIRDFQKTFPEIQPIIDHALMMNHNRYEMKQTKKEQKLFLKFSNAVKVIMKVKFD